MIVTCTKTIYFLRKLSFGIYGMNVNMDKKSAVKCRKARNQPILETRD